MKLETGRGKEQKNAKYKEEKTEFLDISNQPDEFSNIKIEDIKFDDIEIFDGEMNIKSESLK